MMAAVEFFTANAIAANRRCDNALCSAPSTWPIHHVGNRVAFRRLCTACVLRHHRGFFCSVCIEVLESPPLPIGDAAAAGIIHCVRCPSAAHSSCVLQGATSNYLCPVCVDPEGFSYFTVGDIADHPRWPLNAAEARALLSAAQIAAASMSRAAEAARVEAERKVKQAVVANKMAKEMLERVLLMSKKTNEDMKEDMKEEGTQISMKENSSSGNIIGVRKGKKKKKKKNIKLRS